MCDAAAPQISPLIICAHIRSIKLAKLAFGKTTDTIMIIIYVVVCDCIRANQTPNRKEESSYFYGFLWCAKIGLRSLLWLSPDTRHVVRSLNPCLVKPPASTAMRPSISTSSIMVGNLCFACNVWIVSYTAHNLLAPEFIEFVM